MQDKNTLTSHFMLPIPLPRLSPREEQTLNLLIQGSTAKEIAEELKIGRRSAEHYILILHRKFGVNSSRDIITRMRGHLLIPDEQDQNLLTPREKQVLDGLYEGKYAKDMAYEIGISKRTVESYVRNIYSKLGVRSIPQLLARQLAKPYIPAQMPALAPLDQSTSPAP